ncbi:hypothetical protein FVEG_05841 [Fusarium verticillioides 7600]|uniref:Uncharacterized protein n=1 Tax=Gibberella moniliformis (strain M3125 / FGSC 7600) TaxID=334819 RepID=W7MJN0_GIBM7|nr:hypothetical protein FVEG_05841 [Fusarium verticillioides 7600]EWG44872.1 hypothetical protein FVEG_05841 [Fusarium verticillioides 7600]
MKPAPFAKNSVAFYICRLPLAAVSHVLRMPLSYALSACPPCRSSQSYLPSV